MLQVHFLKYGIFMCLAIHWQRWWQKELLSSIMSNLVLSCFSTVCRSVHILMSSSHDNGTLLHVILHNWRAYLLYSKDVTFHYHKDRWNDVSNMFSGLPQLDQRDTVQYMAHLLLNVAFTIAIQKQCQSLAKWPASTPVKCLLLTGIQQHQSHFENLLHTTLVVTLKCLHKICYYTPKATTVS